VQASTTGLWDWDVANNTLYWSPELKGLLGYADDELEIDFDTYEALGHPGDRERTAAAIDVHLKDRVPYEVEQRLRAKSGEYRWFLVRGQAIWDEAGNPLRMAGSFTDFTERKETEAIVERRRGQLECLSDIGQKIGESLPLPEFLQWVAERIPSTMRFPDLCVAAIEFEGTVHGSAEAVKLPHQMVQSLVSDDERVGRLYIAYTEAHDFLDDESALLGDISRRVSGYIESSRLFAQTQAALAEVEATHRSYLRRSWQDHLRQREILQRSGFLYDGSVEGELTHAHPALAPAPDLWRSEMERAVQEGSLAIVEDRDTTGAPDTGDSLAPTERTGMAVPITLRGETIGVLGVEAPGNSHHWTEDDMALIQAVGDQLGQTLETARLFADTQRRAERERLIGEITTKIRASTDMRDILETAAVELGQALGTSRAFVQVGIEELEAQRPLETRPSVEPSGGDGHSVGAAEE
jgi:PAS domain S-box-containing protein